jgi:hypothetical protein
MEKEKKIYLLQNGSTEKGIVRERVSETVLALLLLSGSLFMLRDLMYGGVSLYLSLGVGSLVILILQTFGCMEKTSKITQILLYILVLGTSLVFVTQLLNGFLGSVNQVISLWNLRFGTEWMSFSVEETPFSRFLYWIWAAIPLAVVLLWMTRHKKLTILMIFVTAEIFVSLLLAERNMYTGVLLLSAGILGCFGYFSSPGRKLQLRTLLSILGIVFLAIILMQVLNRYDGSEWITEWKKDTAAWFEKFRFGEDSLPKGEFDKAQELLENEKKTLMVEMKDPQELYLRGFVGGEYSADGWSELSAEAYQGDYAGLLDWLDEEAFSPVTQYSQYEKLSEEETGIGEKSQNIEVNNVGAYRKYAYMPYSGYDYSGSQLAEKKDWQVQSSALFGAREYSFRMLENAPTAENIVVDSWVQSQGDGAEKTYLDAESVYDQFVESAYLDIDDDLRTLLEEKILTDVDTENFTEVTKRIRLTLRTEMIYTESPNKVPRGEDFIRWFLEDEKAGNAVHFATTAVMAYRAAGYPARYVEGYHLNTTEAENMSAENKSIVTLTGKNAHAWVEVYVAGAGWMPVEVVPGMYSESYTNELVEGTPMYQVNAAEADDGLDVETDQETEYAAEQKNSENEPLTVRQIFAIVLLCMYLCFFVFLLLEIQRAVRIAIRKHGRRYARGEKGILTYSKELFYLMHLAGVRGNYNRPYELSDELERRFSGIYRRDYERVIGLLQKNRFSGRKLGVHEFRVLNTLRIQMQQSLYRRARRLRKFYLRYVIALQDND